MANVKISYKKFNCLMYQLIYGQGIFLLLFVVVLKLVVIFFFFDDVVCEFVHRGMRRVGYESTRKEIKWLRNSFGSSELKAWPAFLITTSVALYPKCLRFNL